MSNLLKSTFAKNLSGRASPQLSRRGGISGRRYVQANVSGKS
nr:MAG TPA: hypothetical protein [Caudoviricetes sp.]